MYRKKRFYAFILLAAAAAFVYLFSPYLFRAAFRVSGAVKLSPELAAGPRKPNTMLFIVARNDGGVPFAVRKVINPVFPLDYDMNHSDLILPELLPLRLRLEAFLNTHGEIGSPRKGDFYGVKREPVFIFCKDGDLTLDREH